MKITSITVQSKNKNRVNVSIDGKYRFSLDITQVISLGIKVGREYQESELIELEQESSFGKAYGRTLEYCLVRPRSSKEVRDYLYKKTLRTRTKTGGLKEGWPKSITDRVIDALSEKGYIDDEKFARYWVEYRNQTKGSSLKKLSYELRAKGVSVGLIDEVLSNVERSDETEIDKIINKKIRQYPDRQKLMAYLARQGFDYETIKRALDKLDNPEQF